MTERRASYREGELALATGKIKYLEHGSGVPVVILHHSWGSPGWLPFYDSLAANHRVVVPDMPGWGGSERPVWARDPRDIAIIVGRVLSGLDPSGAKLVGLGLGGYVAAELATMNPSRLAALVLVGAAGLQPRDGEILDQMMLSHRKYIEESFRDVETYTGYVGEEPPDEARQLWDFSREMTARSLGSRTCSTAAWSPCWAISRCPPWSSWGGKDNVVPLECAGRYQAAIPNARVEVIDAAGHVVELEEPHRLAALISSFPPATA